MSRVAGILLSAAVLCGCQVLPHSHSATPSGWRDFDEAKANFDRIVPGETSIEDLRGMGFDPEHTANLRRLNYLELIEVFMPHPSILRADLDPALRSCLEARDACYGYESRPDAIRKARHGNVVLDLLNFRRATRTSGWRFNSLVVVKGETVAYKVWSGEPHVTSEQVETVPLGPLQGAGKQVVDRIAD